MFNMKAWATANGLSEQYEEYCNLCEEIAEQCEAEGHPSNGENYDLRVSELRKEFPDLFF